MEEKFIISIYVMLVTFTARNFFFSSSCSLISLNNDTEYKVDVEKERDQSLMMTVLLISLALI